ncbi:B3 domain-containing transcription factor FUS3-like [Cornus florida]|uniref:B3 domain-containing transcription factor FUS3-like n=1 Tax=Cornus florida TaxID=4283 RepID=UPI002897AA7D|nr:B3 domain-containing transcription factor FUS3-like [Cornus florida]
MMTRGVRELNRPSDQLSRDLVTQSSLGLGCFQIRNRKKRMTRLRRSSLNALLPTTFQSSSSSSSSSSSHVPQPQPQPQPQPIPLPPARAIDPARLRFLFQKQLQHSDVGSLRRMVLPKKAAETHLPVLESKEGFPIYMDDMDGRHVWSFKYRFWPNNSSRMYVLENTGEFVNTHGLHQGDFIVLYKDYLNHNYVIQARKGSEPDPHGPHAEYYESHIVNEAIQAMQASTDAYGGSGWNASNELFLYDFELNRSNNFPMSFPITDDRDSSSFIYETTSSNDARLDFLEPSMTNYPRGNRVESFGSIENLSIDDFYL